MYTLGTSDNTWKDIYVNTLHIGTNAIEGIESTNITTNSNAYIPTNAAVMAYVNANQNNKYYKYFTLNLKSYTGTTGNLDLDTLLPNTIYYVEANSQYPNLLCQISYDDLYSKSFNYTYGSYEIGTKITIFIMPHKGSNGYEDMTPTKLYFRFYGEEWSGSFTNII
jgi:hypothetical protein